MLLRRGARARRPRARRRRRGSDDLGHGASRSTPTCCPQTLTIDDGAAPSATLTAVLIVFGVAVVLVLPALGLLYTLVQRDLIGESEHPSAADELGST